MQVDKDTSRGEKGEEQSNSDAGMQVDEDGAIEENEADDEEEMDVREVSVEETQQVLH